MTESSVRKRAGLAPEQRRPDQVQVLHRRLPHVSGRVAHLLGERALVEVQRVAGVLGGLRVVRDHHDGLAVLAVEHAAAAPGSPRRWRGRGRRSARRRPAGSGRRRSPARSRRAAAGRRRAPSGWCLRAVGRGRPAASAIAARLRLRCGRRQLGEQQRQLDVLLRGTAPASGCRTGRRSRRWRRASCASWPPRELVDALAADRDARPRSGWSRPPIRLSSVVLPEPDGPISATKSPCVDVEVDAVQHLDRLPAALVGLGDGRGSRSA